jgi:hypothetical protein
MTIKKKILVAAGSVIVLVLAAAVFFHGQYTRAESSDWGLNFSQQRAVELGFDPIEMYIAMMADLKPKKIRLMAYWEEIEPNRGEFNFNQVDRMLILAEQTGTEVILVVGKKQPRWPECHEPGWAMRLPKDEEQVARLSMIKTAVEHFKTFPAVKIWQVENEPLFKFGETCPKMDRGLLKEEVALVKSLDTRPVLVTDSGELGRWIPAATVGADLFGSTMYLVVHNPITGYFKYPATPAMFRIKAGVLAFFTGVKKVMGVELQAEPWLADGVLATDVEIQKSLMNQKVFKEYTNFAKEVGFTDNYLWGVEWWYWMAQRYNDWGMWTAAKELMSAETK